MNLLDDHLVDVLLDSAAGGWNTVEREALRECFIGALSQGMPVQFPENTNDNVDTCTPHSSGQHQLQQADCEGQR